MLLRALLRPGCSGQIRAAGIVGSPASCAPSRYVDSYYSLKPQPGFAEESLLSVLGAVGAVACVRARSQATLLFVPTPTWYPGLTVWGAGVEAAAVR